MPMTRKRRMAAIPSMIKQMMFKTMNATIAQKFFVMPDTIPRIPGIRYGIPAQYGEIEDWPEILAPTAKLQAMMMMPKRISSTPMTNAAIP